MAALARAQVASARERLGLSTEEFASVLKPLLGWGPSPGVIANWETDATPPGDVLIAASIVTQAAPLSADEVDKDDLMHQLLGNSMRTWRPCSRRARSSCRPCLPS